MPEVLLPLSAKQRRTTWNPRLRALNVLAEKSDTNRFNGVDHIARPGLVEFAEVGAGTIRGVYRQEGTFGGDFIVTSGVQLYRVTSLGVPTLLGSAAGTDRTITAATATRSITTSGGDAYSSDGTTVTPVVMPDGREVTSVAQLNGYFILPDLNSARVYYIPPGDTNPDGLDFFSTESVPGINVRVERIGDELWFFKPEGVEVWVPTGDPDLPFQRTPGRNYDKGCRAKDTVVRYDNSAAWVGNDGIVYRADSSPVRMSDHSVEESIRKSVVTDLSAWTFAVDGHNLYCLTTSSTTWAYDASSQQWSELGSYERDYWRAHVGDAGDTFTVAGDLESNALWRLDPEVTNDAGQPLVRIVTAGVPIAKGVVRCDSLQVYVTTGTTENPLAYPKMRISWSDNLETYDDFVDVQIGRQGNYGMPVRINALGGMRYPGRLFQLTVTDDVVATISAVGYNEPAR